MIKDRLINRFGKQINHMSCIYLDNGETKLRKLLEHVKGNRGCIEIGTFQGVSALILSEYFEDVFTIDIVKQPLFDKIISVKPDINGFIHSYIIDSLEDKQNIVKDLFKSNDIDFVFIDGEHYGNAVKQDFDMCKQCKYILIHDYSPDFPFVYKLINDLTGYKKIIEGAFCLLVKEST